MIEDTEYTDTNEMTFNGKNNQPRKRSTNMRALSTRVSNLQREMNPTVSLTGTNFDTSKVRVTRKFVTTAVLASGVLAVTPLVLPVPDGAKVLKVRVRNLTGRVLKVSVPTTTGLVLAQAAGSTSAPFGGFQKYHAAPLMRFPTLTLNVPDSLAAPLDSSDTTTQLFSVTGENGASVDSVELTVTALYYV